MTPLPSRRDALLISSILLLAAVLRFWGLGDRSLWIDEGASWAFASRDVAGILTNTLETNPPLYYLLLKGWMALFGDSEAALRSLSAVFSMMAVGLIGWVGNLLGGRRLGLIGMGLLAVMPLPLEYAQTARAYSLFLAATLASYGCLLVWRARQETRWAIGYIASTAVMGYAHHFWVFNFLAQQAYLGWHMLRRRVSWLRGSLLAAGALAACSPWLVVLAQQAVRMEGRGFWLPQPTPRTLLDVLAVQLINGVPAYWVGLYTALAVCGLPLFRAPAGGPARSERWILIPWLIAPVLLPYLWSQWRTPILHPRYTIAAAPALCLLIGLGLLRLRFRLAQAVVGVAILALCAAGWGRYYTEDWRGISKAVREQARAEGG